MIPLLFRIRSDRMPAGRKVKRSRACLKFRSLAQPSTPRRIPQLQSQFMALLMHQETVPIFLGVVEESAFAADPAERGGMK